MPKRVTKKTANATKKPAARTPKSTKKPKLLSGGNPQIAKADGDAPVQAYIAAMPGWKREVGQRLDALIVRTIPNIRKAVRWNSPCFGVEGPSGKPSWFLSIHCVTKYIKVAFFSGSSLSPVPPIESKIKNVRYLHIHEGEWGTSIDEKLMARWIAQAAKLPGADWF